MSEGKSLRVTYFAKGDIICPVCGREFLRETLMTGGGRLIAGDMTDELRRIYRPSKKYGRINPLIYPVTVCPDCFYAALSDDFSKLPEKNAETMREFTDRRIQLALQTVGSVDYSEPRDDRSGAASYILAVSSYSFLDKGVAPTLKRGLCSLRGAWVLNDLIEMTEVPEERERFSWVQNILYRKAHEFYTKALDLYQSGQELIEGVSLGPDVDKDWGYDGFLYTVSQLSLKMGFLEEDLEKRALGYVNSRRVIAKLVGMGKASRAKPSEIIDMSRDLYNKLKQYVEEIEETLGKKFD